MKYDYKLFLGYLTAILHIILALVVYLITVFSFNLGTLFVVFLAVSIILALNKFWKDCPLSKIEEENLSVCLTDQIYSFLPINYDKKKRYEVQLQFIFIIWTILSTKILFAIFQKDLKKILNIKYTNTDITKLIKT